MGNGVDGFGEGDPKTMSSTSKQNKTVLERERLGRNLEKPQEERRRPDTIKGRDQSKLHSSGPGASALNKKKRKKKTLRRGEGRLEELIRKNLTLTEGLVPPLGTSHKGRVRFWAASSIVNQSIDMTLPGQTRKRLRPRGVCGTVREETGSG